MAQPVTMIADAAPMPAAPLPPGYGLRSIARTDVPALGRLYFAAYPPGVSVDTETEAITDIQASFDSEYGELWTAASPAITADDQPVAAVMTVRRATWETAPDGPFIIEVFTDPRHRRRGLARTALTHCLKVVAEAGEKTVALRVDPGNHSAVQLYRSLGFASTS